VIKLTRTIAGLKKIQLFQGLTDAELGLALHDVKEQILALDRQRIVIRDEEKLRDWTR